LELKQFLPFYQYETDLLSLDQLKIFLVSSLDPVNFNDKPDEIPQCFNNSIQTFNNDTNTNLSNQYEMRREDLKKFSTLLVPMPNTTICHS
jgi:hypothetical protein